MSDSLTLTAPKDLQAVAARLSAQLAGHATLFDRLARGVRRKATEDGVHDLRVLTRRLRSILQVASGLVPASALRDLRRRLRKLGRKLGGLRVLDIAIRDAKTYAIDASVLAPRREEALDGLVRALRPLRRLAILRGLRDGSKRLLRSERDRIGDALDRRAEKLREALDRAPESKARMHELRIQVKKARYALEALGRDAEALKPLQRHLGRAHDLETLQDLLGPDVRASRDEQKERDAARRIMEPAVGRALEALA